MNFVSFVSILSLHVSAVAEVVQAVQSAEPESGNTEYPKSEGGASNKPCEDAAQQSTQAFAETKVSSFRETGQGGQRTGRGVNLKF